MCADCNVEMTVTNDEPKCELNCTMCRKYLPCQKASGKTDDIICKDFDNLFPEEEEPVLPVVEDDDIPLPEDYENLPDE